MKTIELINYAWYLSGIVARDLETTSGSESADGLRMLNQVLSNKGLSGRLLPYYETQSFAAVVDQETYFVPNLIELEAITFSRDNVRYSLQYLNRVAYDGADRVNDIKSLPRFYYNERVPGGTNISVYYLPDDTYEFKATGKYGFEIITDVNNDIPVSIEINYSEWLEFELAKKMCMTYNQEWSLDKEYHRKKLRRQVFARSTPDLTMQKNSMFRGRYTRNYAFANIGGKGFPV